MDDNVVNIRDYQKSSGGFMIDTPEGIEAFRLLQMRGRLQLEVKGLRFRINTAQAIRREFGLKTRSKKKLLEEYEAILREKGVLKDA